MTPEQKAKRAAYQKAWRAKQSPEKQEKMREQIRRWHHIHRDEQNIKRRILYRADPSAHQETTRKRLAEIKADPVLFAAFTERRRRSKREKIRGITESEWLALIDTFGQICAYCLEPFTPTNPAEPDHMIPVKMGGPKNLNNVVPACRHCNARKQSKHLLRFLYELWGVGGDVPKKRNRLQSHPG